MRLADLARLKIVGGLGSDVCQPALPRSRVLSTEDECYTCNTMCSSRRWDSKCKECFRSSAVLQDHFCGLGRSFSKSVTPTGTYIAPERPECKVAAMRFWFSLVDALTVLPPVLSQSRKVATNRGASTWARIGTTPCRITPDRHCMPGPVWMSALRLRYVYRHCLTAPTCCAKRLRLLRAKSQRPIRAQFHGAASRRTHKNAIRR